MMGSPGDWISVTGGGTFDVAARRVKAAGVFVHHRADGAVECQGTVGGHGLQELRQLRRDPEGPRRRGPVDPGHALLHDHVDDDDRHPDDRDLHGERADRLRQGTTVAVFMQPTGGIVAISGA
jgi:hypothetical protein